MNQTRIVLLCVAAAVGYGVVHDQITVRVCLEYFTIGHPPLFPTTSPTLLALGWGIAATIGMGALFGFVLANLSHAGSAPPLAWTHWPRPVARLLTAMAAAAIGAGFCGYGLANQGLIAMPAVFTDLIARDRHGRFIAAWFTHGASYLVGLSGSGWLAYRTWKARGRPESFTFLPRSRAAMLRAAIILGIAASLWWQRFRAD